MITARIARLQCRFLGCAYESHGHCDRCGSALYDPNFIQYGWLDPLFRFYWKARRFIRRLGPRKCYECGKRIRRGYCSEHPEFCSEKCFDNWIPF